MRRARAPGRDGFTLIEVLLAMVLFAVGAVALSSHTSAARKQDKDREVRLMAHRIAHNEVEHARSADPWTASASSTLLFDRTGAPTTATGPTPWVYRATVTRAVSCTGGTMVQDNALAPTPTGGCAATRPTHQFAVRVFYRSSLGSDSVVGSVRIAPSLPHGATWAALNEP